jgi:gluconate 2-dehydrogenase gamma chain
VFSLNELPALDRRALLRNAILLAGGSMAAASPVAGLAQSKKAARFFSPAQMIVLTEVLDIMVPRTDTPGAKDAGVPASMDMMMRNWASAERKAQFAGLVDEIGGMGLMKMKRPERVELIRNLDAQRLQAWDPAYVKFKELSLTLFYLSEEGANKELAYELTPGVWDPWTELAPDQRVWAL